MTIHLVTSGCSFSDNYSERWPHYLSSKLNMKLYNRGCGSAGNDYISKSIIYQTQILLDNGIPANKILIAVMWSGIDRKDLFIDYGGIDNYDKLINDHDGHPNPTNFLDNEPNVMNKPVKSFKSDGYLHGAASCSFKNNYINKFKAKYILNYLSLQALAIESYENFLRLQWFCESKKIKLINQTYMDILHYPKHKPDNAMILTKDWFRNITPLYNMIDFTKWALWNNSGGLYEYSKDNNLNFYQDNVHPLPEAHFFYVNNFLIPKLKELKYV